MSGAAVLIGGLLWLATIQPDTGNWTEMMMLLALLLKEVPLKREV